MPTAHHTTCQQIAVPATACYVRFADTASVGSAMLEYQSARGERLIADFDAEGRIIGIELLGAGKPCQETGATMPEQALRPSESEP